MSEKKELILRVADAPRKYANMGIAILNRQTMRELGVESGDVIEIEGKKVATAIVWPDPLGGDPSVIRIDGNIRRNAGVAIDDRVKVRKTVAKEARRIVLQPTQPVRIAGGARYLARVLRGRPLTKGQVIRIDMLGSPIAFEVVNTVPSGTVIPTSETEIVLREAREGAEIPRVTYEDIGGLKKEIQLIREMIELPLRHPELFERLGIEPPKGVLLYGPPGTGKTLIAKAVANETAANFYSISGPEIMSKYYGESERQLREIFEEARRNAPSIIFIDEIDSIAPKREETHGEVERRVVAQLLALMDGLEARGQIVVIGATNRVNAIDPALRRPGRFDREIEIGIPDRDGREEILQVHTRGMPLASDVDLKEIADLTHGFVGADLAALCKEAAMHALRRILPEIDIEAEEIPPEVMEKLEVRREDFMEALKNIEPSALREVFVEVPNVRWDDIGDLDEVKKELREVVEWPIKYPEVFRKLDTKPPKGILLFGPPGTGKTMLAKAVANESEANFISIKGPELLCVSANTPIFTNQGLIPISHLYETVKNDSEANFEANFEVLTLRKPVFTFGVNEEGKIVRTAIKRMYKLFVPVCYKLAFTNNSEIVVSANQPFLTLSEGEIVWKRAEDLKCGDIVAVPAKLGVFNEKVNGKSKESKNTDAHSGELSEESAEFLGWFVSDGSKDAFHACGNACTYGNAYGNIKPAERTIQIPAHAELARKKHDVRSDLREILGTSCIESGKISVTSVISRIISSSADVIAGFLRGVLLGDGHVSDRRIEFVTKDEELASGIVYMLTQLGVKSRYLRIKGVHIVRISGKEARRFKRIVCARDVVREVVGEDGRDVVRDVEGDVAEDAVKDVVRDASEGDARDLRWVCVSAKERAEPQVMYDVETELSSFVGGKLPMILHNSKWVGESLPYDEKIFVRENGHIKRVPIGEVVENEMNVEVVSFDSDGKVRFTPISAHIRHPRTKQIKEIKTATGRKIRVTDDHSLFTFDGNEIRSVSVSELKKGSYVVIPKRIPSPQSSAQSFAQSISASILQPSQSVLARAFENGEMNESTMSEDICMLLGLCLADGDYTPFGVRISGDEDVLRAVEHACSRLSLNVSVGRGHININISAPARPARTQETHETQSKTEKIRTLIESALRARRVPEIIWSLGKREKAAFLRGYFSGEGSIHEDVIRCNAENEEIADDLMYLLLEFGIVASAREQNNGKYVIEISGIENLKRFSAIGFIDERRNKQIKSCIASIKAREARRKAKKTAISEQIPLIGALRELVVRVREDFRGKNVVSRGVLREILEAIDASKEKYPNYWRIVDSEICFDRVVSIKDSNYDREYVYDISVEPTESFLGGFGGIFAHNSERAVREVFRKARQAAPCVVFLDEIDSIAPVRGMGYDSHVTERVVSQLLTELDGIEELKDVVVIAATNRPDMVDPALLRPGRFDRLIYVKPPDKEARKKIFEVHLRGKPLAKDVSIDELAARTEGYVGADIAALVREATMAAIREFLNSFPPETDREHMREAAKNIVIKKKHFDEAFKTVKPSASRKTLEEFEAKSESMLRRAYV